MSGTIFAPATPAGRSGVAIMRISGPEAARIVETLTGGDLPPARKAALRDLRASDGAAIDRGLVLWFPGPASFTGEDMAELHLHGGPAVLAAMAARLLELGLRPAEPGAFTRRAFDNGKLDLTEVEGLADLIAAETDAQRRQALRQMSGALGALIESWRGDLLAALARLEAVIDFSDQDLPEALDDDAAKMLRSIVQQILQHLSKAPRAERLRDGLSVAILGAPNAGKSSLLNRLAGRDAAIVSAEAGTTRDVIELAMDLDGYPLLLADTAGLRESTHAIEAEGVRRALDRAAKADLKLVVLDGAAWPNVPAESAAQIDGDTLLVLNKSDLLSGAAPDNLSGHPLVALSTRTGAGIDTLVMQLTARAKAMMESGASAPFTRERHRLALEDCLHSLQAALLAPTPELAAEDLRLATRALGRITGRVDVEDILDAIFRDFCIGK